MLSISSGFLMLEAIHLWVRLLPIHTFRLCGHKKMRINAIYIAAWLSAVPLISLADTGFKNELDTYVINNGSAEIEHLGQGLMRELEKRKPHFTRCSYHEYASDAPKPIGDGKASNHIIIKCQDHADLGIRFSLRSSGKFRILGYWSANS